MILFDEIEKANPDVFNMFLQILDEGKITDSLGNKVDFRNTIIVFTSNIGTERLSHKGNLGFADEANSDLQKKEYVLAELKNHLRPEFLNRIDEIVVFNSLRGAELEAIFDKMIDEINESIAIQGIVFKVGKDVRSHIIGTGFDEKYGARSIRRSISRSIEIPASERLLQFGDTVNPETEIREISVLLRDGDVDFKIKTAAKPDIEPVHKTTRKRKSGKKADPDMEASEMVN